MKKLFNKKSMFIPIVVCLAMMFSLGVFAYQSSGARVSFTLDNVNRKYSNRNASTSWQPTGKDYAYFQCNKINRGSGILRTLQCVEQRSAFDRVVYEVRDIKTSLSKVRTRQYENPFRNRTFVYAERKEGIYEAQAYVSW